MSSQLCSSTSTSNTPSATSSPVINSGSITPETAVPQRSTPRFSDSPNARSKGITRADGPDTYGVLNRHPAPGEGSTYQVGTIEDKGARRTMEDAHSFVVDFGGVRGQGFFAVFDGHAGKHAAEWCGSHFHEELLDTLRASSADASIPDVLNQTFHTVDERISKLCEESEGKIHSGCTAVTVFLRIEDADGSGKQSFLAPETYTTATVTTTTESHSSSSSVHQSGSDDETTPSPNGKKHKKNGSSSGSRIKKAIKSLSGSSHGSDSAAATPTTPRSLSPVTERQNGLVVQTPPPSSRRVLYSANAGDARAVLCRAGKAVRLTYDHKGTDKQEAKRITDAGGFVMSGRVNGVLAVTRSLGDSSMKEFVVGAPYTTETELCEQDEFLILACDGLWDVVSDQAAVDLVRSLDDAQYAAQKLLQFAMSHHTSDNVTIQVVRFNNKSSSAST